MSLLQYLSFILHIFPLFIYSQQHLLNHLTSLLKNYERDRNITSIPFVDTQSSTVSVHTLSDSQYKEAYHLILQPVTSQVNDTKIEDYETSVYIEPPYPNPVTRTVHIPVWRYTKTVKREDISLKCYSILGLQIADLTQSLNTVSDEVSIADWDMSDLPQGVYIIKSSSVTRKGNVRIVVKAGR